MGNVIKVKGLYKDYHDFKLKDVNLVVPKGKIVGLIGENGSGKTTTLKAILNLISTDKGSIKIFDKDINKLTTLDKEKIGVVLDDSFLSVQYTVKDINNIMKHFYNTWDEELFNSLVKKYKLPTNKIIKEFSNGMRMKVKLLCCLAHKPSLLILDEFTNGLDPVFRYEILDLLSKEAKDSNLSILMSTHITSDVEHIADNILFIDNGKILLDITKKDLFDNYKIIKCSKELFNKIDKKDYIKYLEYKDDNLVIVKDLKEFKKKYKDFETRNNSIEELMLMFIKGKDSHE